MKEEIKEILEFDHFENLEELKQNVENWIKEDEMYWERWFGLRDIKTLLDYITNLQEENVRFREINKEQANHLISKDNLSYEDYKSRIDKAISLLKEAGCYDEETKTFCDDVWEELPDLLNILQGEDK